MGAHAGVAVYGHEAEQVSRAAPGGMAPSGAHTEAPEPMSRSPPRSNGSCRSDEPRILRWGGCPGLSGGPSDTRTLMWTWGQSQRLGDAVLLAVQSEEGTTR